MKKVVLCLWCALTNLTYVYSQNNPDYSAIKLYVDNQMGSTISGGNDFLSDEFKGRLQTRLYDKVTHMISQAGIAEIGYSTFSVIPKMEVVSNSVDESGMAKIYMAECQLYITIERRAYSGQGAAVYASFTRRLIGSAMAKEDAVSDAINNLSASDTNFTIFLEQSKVKITTYFQTHCNDVLAEANQALGLHQYARAIALYFSIPSNAPKKCYEEAQNTCLRIYKNYLEDACIIQLIKLKAYVARALNTDSEANSYYDSALAIVKDLNPASKDCYALAEQQIQKIESRFDQRLKQEWDMKKKQAADDKEIQKGVIQAISKISSSYQPPAAPAVIITR